MRRLILAAAALAATAGGALAFSSATGTVATVTKQSLTLTDGSAFSLPDAAQNAGIKAGDKVVIFGDNVDQGDATSVVVLH